MTAALRAFVTRHLIAVDPAPAYSRLDRMDGLNDSRIQIPGAVTTP